MRVSQVAAASLAAFCIAGAAYAGSQVEEVIRMENPAYAKHKKGIVAFSHKKHVEEYGATCMECHHDETGTPIDPAPGENVQSCIRCHDKPGQKPRKKKLSRKEKLAYHAEAVHMNCKACHRAFNKKTGTKDAPVSCKACHPKN